MKSRWTVPAIACAAALVTTMAGATTADATPARPAPPTVSCEFTPTPENPAAKPVRAPRPKAPARGTTDVTLLTNYGPVTIELDHAGHAPCAVHNMISLIHQRFYNHTQCFRLTNSARLGVLQCGDLYSVEKGGPGYKFADEVDGTEKYPRGTVAMGNQGPGTNGSQFFVVHSFANIAPNYSVMGKVTRGMWVLDRIVRAGIVPGETDPLDGAPAKPVRIEYVFTSCR
ncbi:peptidylprolyl isomerase [Amycolatopsis minnesotensis]|uniref:Peptidyl-prolyl cis-trans isomerase n=1 Tax=Amycolatopsis minnesotensis TaxID=337894 RepID=A0ABN2SUN2_9PSEU